MDKQYFYLKKDGNEKNVWDFFKSQVSELMQQCGCSIIISPYAKNKTDQQRKYAHACISVIAKDVGENPAHLKIRIKAQLGLIEKVWNDGEVLTIEKSTEKLKKAEYGIFIEAILSLASALNIKVPPPKTFGMEEF